MKMYYLKMLLFTFLINILGSPHNEKYINNHYNINVIQNDTQRTTINSRLLAQTKNHNPHYHNDPELKEIIDKMNEEAIKKYQQTHDPYKQLKDVVERKRNKTYKWTCCRTYVSDRKRIIGKFGDKSHIMLKSGINPNDDDRSDNSLTCEYAYINNSDLTKTKGKDKYLVNLKERCKSGIGFCAVGSILLTLMGFIAAGLATATYFKGHSALSFIITILHCFTPGSLKLALEGAGVSGVADIVGTVPTYAMTAFQPYGIAALVLLILAVVLIILYIWLYRRRKNSLKHECKKHLCK
ncbi:PIR protein [Plasmodium sp. gorilla clade G1]|nr:PIR protein [Plasmodium sp. gorilla clade G1]